MVIYSLVPLLERAAVIAPVDDGEDGNEPRDVEDPLDPRLDAVADADHVALAGLDRPAARVEQRPQDGGIHKGGGGEVDHDAAAASERLVEPLPQRRRGVDVVLAFDDDYDDVAGGLVKDDGVGVHTGVHDTYLGPKERHNGHDG